MRMRAAESRGARMHRSHALFVRSHAL